MNRILAVLALLAVTTAFHASEEPSGREPDSTALFIRGGTLHTISHGVIPGGSLLVRDGRIHKIGRNLVPPSDAVILNAEGKWIMPGFIVVNASAVSMRPIIREDPNPRIIDYMDPYGLELLLCLASGITAFSPNLGATQPNANYSFRNAVLKPAYGRLEDMLIKEPAYLHINMPGLTAAEKNELRVFLLRAGDHISQEWEHERPGPTARSKAPAPSPDIAPYVAVMKKTLPVRFQADTKKDLLKVFSFVDEFDLNAQILGAAEGWRVVEDIGRRNISTIIQTPGVRWPIHAGEIPGGLNIQNAAIQNEGGVRFGLINPNPSMDTGGLIGDNLLTFPLAGAFAVRGGLEESRALKALTLIPAELLEISHRVGSLEVGKDADIIILDGNPLDTRTYVEYTILDGRLVYDKSSSPLFRNIEKPGRLF